jgi:hypothetical protein
MFTEQVESWAHVDYRCSPSREIFTGRQGYRCSPSALSMLTEQTIVFHRADYRCSPSVAEAKKSHYLFLYQQLIRGDVLPLIFFNTFNNLFLIRRSCGNYQNTEPLRYATRPKRTSLRSGSIQRA